MNLKGKLKIIAVVIGLSALALAAFFLLSHERSESKAGLLQELEFKKTGVRIIPAGWKEYRNELHGFSLLHKEGLTITQYDEGGGASTITFEDKEAGAGFQIFVVPYGEEKITEERFLKDSPLGVMNSPKDLEIDSAPATSFYGQSERLGETWEIWFIHRGLLYEVSTTKSLENWLSDIIETWRFL